MRRGWRRALRYLGVGVVVSSLAVVLGLEVWYRTLLPKELGRPQRLTLPPLVRKTLLIEVTRSADEPTLPFLFPFLLTIFRTDDASLYLASTAGRMELSRLRDSGALPEREGNLTFQLRWAALTTWVSRNWTPDEALETFASRVWVGDGVYGLTGGAMHYFGVPLDALSPAQAALLIGIIQSPNPLHPGCHPERALERRSRFLELMLEQGVLDSRTFDAATREPLATIAACAH